MFKRTFFVIVSIFRFFKGEVVSNHDELMSNFFAQPDALALGKTAEQYIYDFTLHELLHEVKKSMFALVGCY